MKQLLLPTLFLLTISCVFADIEVKSVQKEESIPVFSFDGSEGLKITPRIDLDETHIFVDGTLIQSYEQLTAKQTRTVDVPTGTHTIEIRTLKTFSYAWDRYKIIKNDEPLFLDYVNHLRDQNRIIFALKGVELIHPNDLERTVKSVNTKLNTNTVLLNEETQLNCYPTVTTGRPLGFSCQTGLYPYTLNITITTGFREKENVTITAAVPEPEVYTATTTSQGGETTSTTETQANRNAPILDNIELTDLIPEQTTEIPLSIKALFIILIITVLTLLFIVREHNHRGKQEPNKQQKTPKKLQEAKKTIAAAEQNITNTTETPLQEQKKK